MADINNLQMRFSYPGGQNLPVILMLHGWGGSMTNITDVTMERIANYGAFVCSVGMRGRDGADGSNDASGREIYDIYDALQELNSRYPYAINTDKVAVWGYSGGGGNALATVCKFPDAFNIAVSFFGISDYGRDSTDGWYQNADPAEISVASIATAVGGTPVEVPNNYYARDATAAITNFADGGYVYMFHDKQDAIVPYVHSTRIKTALDAAGSSDYSYNASDIGDPLRYYHGLPDSSTDCQDPEEDIVDALIASSTWTIPASGTVTVIGYIVTKRFTIWLNSGLDAAATVVYNTSTHQYTVTPLTTADITVSITEGALTASDTISGEHTFTCS